MSNAAVQARTGKTWAEWCRILDQAGGRNLNHREIAAWVDQNYPAIGGWWAQMVTVGYERARGKRTLHQKADGYSVSRSKTVAVPVARLFSAWKDARAQARWLQDAEMQVSKATAPKSMRIAWAGGSSRVDVNFYSKGAAKSQVTVQHNRLPDARAAKRMQRYWGRNLDRLGKMLGA